MTTAIALAVAAFGTSLLTLFSGFGLGTLLLPAFAFFLPLEVAVASTAVVHAANNLFKVGLLAGDAVSLKMHHGGNDIALPVEVEHFDDEGALLWGRLPGLRGELPELWLEAGEPVAARQVRRTPRIGVDYAGAWARRRLRYVIAGHPDASGPRRLR